MSVFVHAQGIKTVHAGGGVKKWQNSVHLVVECPPTLSINVLFLGYFGPYLIIYGRSLNVSFPKIVMTY